MESCSDSDSNDDGHEIGRHGHGDEDIVINTEHASKEVDAEGDGEAEAVAREAQFQLIRGKLFMPRHLPSPSKR